MVAKVSQKFEKPIIFTEIGFRPVEGTWKDPHAEVNGRSFNAEGQRRCYEAVMKGLQDQDWCAGILWWKWPSYLAYGLRNKTGFAPYHHPAEKVVKKWFSQ